MLQASLEFVVPLLSWFTYIIRHMCHFTAVGLSLAFLQNQTPRRHELPMALSLSSAVFININCLTMEAVCIIKELYLPLVLKLSEWLVLLGQCSAHISPHNQRKKGHLYYVFKNIILPFFHANFPHQIPILKFYKFSFM